MCKFYYYVPLSTFISSQYLLLDNEFSHCFYFLTDYMTVAETVDIDAKRV